MANIDEVPLTITQLTLLLMTLPLLTIPHPHPQGPAAATVAAAWCGLHTTAVTHKYPNWKMIKEVKNRKAVKEFAFERININAMRKNKILPPELQVCISGELLCCMTVESLMIIKMIIITVITSSFASLRTHIVYLYV